jgi:hypothetical protein
MPDSTDNFTNQFTFLNYSSPGQSALHRRAVKSHISSKYRIGVRLQTQTRYALPQRTSPAGPETPKPKRPRNEKAPPCIAISSPSLGSAQLPSPLEVGFSGTRADPFTSFPGQVTPCSSRALDYFVQGMSPVVEPLVLAMNMPNPLMVWMYPLAMSHESGYHSVVALSLGYLEKRLTPAARASTEVIYHRCKPCHSCELTCLTSKVHQMMVC